MRQARIGNRTIRTLVLFPDWVLVLFPDWVPLVVGRADGTRVEEVVTLASVEVALEARAEDEEESADDREVAREDDDATTEDEEEIADDREIAREDDDTTEDDGVADVRTDDFATLDDATEEDDLTTELTTEEDVGGTTTEDDDDITEGFADEAVVFTTAVVFIGAAVVFATVTFGAGGGFGAAGFGAGFREIPLGSRATIPGTTCVRNVKHNHTRGLNAIYISCNFVMYRVHLENKWIRAMLR